MKQKRTLRRVVIAIVIGSVSIFASSAAQAQGVAATATLQNAQGQTVGSAMLAEVAGGVRITLQARNLLPGPHGIHLHAVGRCDPPDFTSSGGHFNPTGQQHGLQNPQGPHAGDLPQLVVAANGTVNYTAINTMVSLSPGQRSLLDGDGTAVVIHADADDQVTDPTGNSGGRIACGVLVRGASTLPATGTAPIGSGPAGVLAAGALALVSFGAVLRSRSQKR